MKTLLRCCRVGLCVLVGLGVLVSPLSVRAESDKSDDPFSQGADDAAKRDPFFKKPTTRPAPKRPIDPGRTVPAREPGRGDDAADPPARGKPVKLSAREAEIAEKIVNHYLEMYGKYLRSGSWVTRAMAVVYLARIDAAQITEKLLAVATKDRDAKVSVYAWEALHARTTSLSVAQHARWLAAGCRLAQRGNLGGDTRVGFVRAIGAAAPTAEYTRALMSMFAKTSLQAGADAPVLAAMRETVAAWKSPELIRQLVAQMGNVNTAHRADYVLSGLGATAASGASLENHTDRKESTARGKKWVTYTRMGSRAAWAQTRKDWAAWLGKTKPTPPTADELVPYAGKSFLIAPAEMITDPTNPKWTKDLELPKFELKTFEVNFVLDSTGSMSQTMTWIKGDIGRMMRALALVSQRPRMGVTLYRDFASGMAKEDYLVTASDDPRASRYGRSGNYVVKIAPMMVNADRLAKAIQSASAYGGGDTPEAVYEAIWAAVNKNTWARSGVKLIVLVGDAPPHAKSMDKLKKLAEQSAGKGFKFLCVKVSDAYRKATVRQEYAGKVCDLETSFNLIAQWGKGKAVALESSTSSSAMRRAYYARISSSGRSPYTDTPPGTDARDDKHHRIIAEVLKVQLADYYHDRVDPFVRILLELVVVSPPETRTVIPPYSQSREVRVIVSRPDPKPRPMPVKPRPEPKRPKIERVYYVIDKKALAYVYYDFDNKQTLSAAIYVDNQGRYTWQYLRGTDTGRISTRGKKISDERAREIMNDLAKGTNPFK